MSIYTKQNKTDIGCKKKKTKPIKNKQKQKSVTIFNFFFSKILLKAYYSYKLVPSKKISFFFVQNDRKKNTHKKIKMKSKEY